MPKLSYWSQHHHRRRHRSTLFSVSSTPRRHHFLGIFYHHFWMRSSKHIVRDDRLICDNFRRSIPMVWQFPHMLIEQVHLSQVRTQNSRQVETCSRNIARRNSLRQRISTLTPDCIWYHGYFVLYSLITVWLCGINAFKSSFWGDGC